MDVGALLSSDGYQREEGHGRPLTGAILVLWIRII